MVYSVPKGPPQSVLLVRQEEETKDSFYNWKTMGSFGMLQEYCNNCTVDHLQDMSM